MDKKNTKIKRQIRKLTRRMLKAGARALLKVIEFFKGLSFKKIASGISRLGDKIIKKVCSIGSGCIRGITAAGRFIYDFAAHKAVRFICDTGDWVMRTSVKVAKTTVKVIMWIPRSFVRDFSYWAPSLAGVAVVALIFSSNFYALALKVTVDGKVIGYVDSEGEFVDVVSQVENTMGETIGENYVMASTPEYSFAIVSKTSVDNTETLYEGVYDIASSEIGENYGLFVDGELIAASEDEQMLNDVLESVKEPFKSGDSSERVEFIADVEIKKGLYAPSYFYSKEVLEQKFSQAADPVYYTIQEDDLLTYIAEKTGVSRSQLYALNPGLDERRLIPGHKLNISQPEIYLGVQVVKTITYTEEIDYSVTRIENSDMYKNTTSVKTAGVKGEKEITAEVTYVDGVETSTKEISSKVIKEPVTKEIYVGTKARPVYAPTGSFIRPISGGYVSCSFGGYRGHTGVDLTKSGAYGSSVYASDGGTVTFAGWSGGYGKLIKIRHDNGYETWYAHLSAINVSVGQTVRQGATIGKIGSTGNSTGPHLHFELRKNGTALNPMRYI